jgi:nicotinamide-nucleotide amidase
MKSPQDAAGDVAGFAGVVARAAIRRGCTIAAAESVSAGSVAVGLAAADQASTWFRGSLVAYSSGVKFDVLKVQDAAAVITADAAVQMARGAPQLLGADITVVTTGAPVGPIPRRGSHRAPCSSRFAARVSSCGSTVTSSPAGRVRSSRQRRCRPCRTFRWPPNRGSGLSHGPRAGTVATSGQFHFHGHQWAG